MPIHIKVTVTPGEEVPVSCEPNPVPVPRARIDTPPLDIEWDIPVGYKYHSLWLPQQQQVFSTPSGSDDAVTVSVNNAATVYPYDLVLTDGTTYYHSQPQGSTKNPRIGAGGTTIRNN